MFTKVKCFFRKWLSAKIIPSLVLNSARISLYRLCGYRIGKNVFIGMHCYLDDLAPELFTVEDNVTISYGCYFACHGKYQNHYPITIKNGAYLGMCSRVISYKSGGDISGVTIGAKAVIGACTLVNKDIPDGATAVGVPCRIIKEKNE